MTIDEKLAFDAWNKAIEAANEREANEKKFHSDYTFYNNELLELYKEVKAKGELRLAFEILINLINLKNNGN